MNILKRIWEAVRKLFSNTKIGASAQKMNVKPAVNGEMLDRLTMWSDMWKGRAHWINEKKGVLPLHIERDVAKEFANTVTSEMTVKITDRSLQDIFDRSVRNLSEQLQEGLASGALVIKPLGGAKVQFVSQFDFLPTEYDSEKRLTGVIFPDCRKLGDRYYTRLEYHHIGKDGLTIENRAFVSSYENDLGRETDLSAVPEWAGLPERETYPVFRPIYGYYRNPIVNTIDGSCAGVSVYDSAWEKIMRGDIQAGRLDWEFESGERRIHVDAQAVKLSNGTSAVLDSRLYKGLDLMPTGGELYKEYSPALRQSDFIDGLEEIKREIEFSVGLAYGDLSNAQNVDKTATEMKISRQRKFRTVKAMQDNLRDCLDDLCFGLAFMNEKVNTGYEFNCTFRDSIMTDEETQREEDRRDVSMGVMPAWEYRMKWYGEDEKTARRMTDESAAGVLE